MTDIELEQVIDELADVQQAIIWVLFRRGKKTLRGVGELQIVGRAADRLRSIADQFDFRSAEQSEAASNGDRPPAKPFVSSRKSLIRSRP